MLLYEAFRGAGIYVDRRGFKYRLNERGIRVPLKNPEVKPETPISHPKPEKLAQKAAAPEKANKGSKTAEFLNGKPKKIKSSYITHAKYDRENEILRLSFKNTPKWFRYEDISPKKAREFFNSDSKGSWFWDNIRVRGSRTEHQVSWSQE